MGDHPNDLSIEQILEKEHKEKARQLAEKEVFWSFINGQESFS